MSTPPEAMAATARTELLVALRAALLAKFRTRVAE